MNKLLEKYWKGDTSLQEEQQLQSYFKGDKVSAEHEVYRKLFHGFEIESSIEIDSYDAFAKVKSQESSNHIFKKRTWTSVAVAASVAVMVAVGSGYYQQDAQADLGTYETPEEAYSATVEALQMVSSKFNKGKENLKPVNQIEKQTLQVFNINQL
ncbi:hypothetical protein [Nonlabens antarcticus]|uniref:hypothetical protein n=1 Tax=Nonlabens antarcticus TaxID=392714 RepID=UPI0018910ABF|nr:hypothetical protein [Nonlabens antarcticus]